MKNLRHRNDKFVTVHNKCSKTSPSTSVHFATRVLRSRVVRLSWSSRFFMQAAASKMRASNSSVYPPLFCKLRSSSNCTNKIVTELGLQIQTALYRWPFRIIHMFLRNLFLTMANSISSQYIYLSSCINLYIHTRTRYKGNVDMNYVFIYLHELNNVIRCPPE